MTAYVVAARICDVRPYRTSRRDEAVAASARALERSALPATSDEGRVSDIVEFDGREPDRRGWTDVVVGWTETTFYLFDPESWR